MKNSHTTIQEVLQVVRKRKPMCRDMLYIHLRALRIKPLGQVPQRPQLYPPDTATKILHRLGLK